MKNSFISRRAVAACLALCGLAALQPAFAQTQDYPNKPIRLIVGFPAGGAVDMFGRLIAERLQEQLGQSIVVENKPGANGNVATEYLAKVAPDGYTIMIGGSGLSSNPPMYPNAGYSLTRDITGIASLGYSALFMVAPTTSKYNSVRDIIAQSKAVPNSVSYASAGAGSSANLSSELLKVTAQVEILHVPYKGGAPALVDLISDRVSFMMLDPAQSMPHVRSGRLKVLAVGSRTRSPLVPEVPTVAEAGGYPNYVATVWWGFVAPAKTPPEIVNKLNTEINKALSNPAVVARLAELGVEPEKRTPAEFTAYMRTEMEKWATVVKAAGLKGD